MSNSIADLSSSLNNSKLSSTINRLSSSSTIQSKLDNCHNDLHEKILLSQNKSSLIIYMMLMERIQWSDDEIIDLYIYRDDSIIIIGEHKQRSSKPLDCKLYLCNLIRKQLEHDLNSQSVASDEKLIFYGSEKGCQFVRCIDLYELNIDNMNRLITHPVSLGVITTDGENKKIWAVGPEGEKRSLQYRPWRSSVGFLATDVLVILPAGCLTFHVVNHTKQLNNGTKFRNIITNVEKF
ncbi:unnamed protein product [Adineta steineri]|uniref:Uncharacterized protein n=1 Tax=Adineta steineri TaxID=433720 RepID=A0A819PW16_9BILA|nr:unnamed protein product [Adineta steineri]CAF3985079.1 unnamed protein product [Adineta steineri]CAF4019281.1 unnamed protein product [Adineta steineri]